MLEQLLPACAAVVETRGDLEEPLFAEEEATLGETVEKRRREFVTGRACARAALAQLGVPPGPVLADERGAPLWPAGVVGSITHCAGYRACAVASVEDLLSIGIDAEPAEPLPAGLLSDIALPEERAMLRDLYREAPGVSWDRILFSAKEAVYKAWYPLTRRWLGFEDAVLALDIAAGAYSARLLVPGPEVEGRELTGFDGRWAVEGGLVIATIVVAGHGEDEIDLAVGA